MGRAPWQALPAAARAAVEGRTGPISSAAMLDHGMVADLTCALDTATGRIFCKGVRADSRAAWFHDSEAEAAWCLPPGIAPPLLWEVRAAGWLLLGFEWVAGRHPDLSPDSSDLGLVLDTVAKAAERLTPCPPYDRKPLSERWSGRSLWLSLGDDPGLHPWVREHLLLLADWEVRAPGLIDGDTLAHTDLNAENILLTAADQARIVDWSWPARAAAWCDAAFLVPKLIQWGHTTEQAEQVAATAIPAFAGAPAEALTAFAASAAAVTERIRRADPCPIHTAQAAARISWARHRLRRHV